jgi:hypothetical protein
MSTLDEITNEKQRIGEALARIDAQREKLTGQLGELEAAERVLARYSKGTPARKIASAKTPTTATKAAAEPRPRRPRTGAEESAGGKRTSSTLVLCIITNNITRLGQGRSGRCCPFPVIRDERALRSRP